MRHKLLFVTLCFTPILVIAGHKNTFKKWCCCLKFWQTEKVDSTNQEMTRHLIHQVPTIEETQQSPVHSIPASPDPHAMQHFESKPHSPTQNQPSATDFSFVIASIPGSPTTQSPQTQKADTLFLPNINDQLAVPYNTPQASTPSTPTHCKISSQVPSQYDSTSRQTFPPPPLYEQPSVFGSPTKVHSKTKLSDWLLVLDEEIDNK